MVPSTGSGNEALIVLTFSDNSLVFSTECVCALCKVYEVVPCLSDCGQYVWVAEPWSVWKVSNVDLNDNCGEGVQTRKVR